MDPIWLCRTDKVPQSIAKKRQIIVTNARGIFEDAVARHTVFNSKLYQ